MCAQTTLTFEGLSHNTPVGSYSGVTFGSLWRSIIDSDAGGGGNFANEPSPSTTALAFGIVQVNTRITFPYTIGSGSFYYALNNTPGSVTVHFFNSAGTEIGTGNLNVCGAAAPGCGAACLGDPGGIYCSWTQVSLMPGTAYMEFSGAPVDQQFLIDDLTFQAPSIPTMNEWGMIIFMVFAGIGSVYYLRRQRRI